MSKRAERFLSTSLNGAFSYFSGGSTVFIGAIVFFTDRWPDNNLKLLIILISSILIFVIVMIAVFAIYLLLRIKDLEETNSSGAVPFEETPSEFKKI